MRKSPYYYYLPAALVSLVMTIFLGYPFSRHSASHEHTIKPIEYAEDSVPVNQFTEEEVKPLLQKVASGLERELAISAASLEEVKDEFTGKQGLSFSTLPYTGKYPVFIYKNDQLVYWTDYKYTIEKENINGKFRQQCVENNNGIFILTKDVIRIDSNRYQFVAATPLHLKYKIDNQYIKSSLNKDIFPDHSVSLSLSPEEGYPVKSAEGRFLFSIVPEGKEAVSPAGFMRKYGMFFFASLTVVFSILLIRINVQEYIHQNKIWQAFILLIAALVSIRLLMLFFDLPFRLTNYDLFHSRSYPVSVISPSLGDLLLNMAALCVISGFIYFYYHKLLNLRALISASAPMSIIISVLLSLISFIALYFNFSILQNIYFNSQVSLDITSELSFSPYKLVCLGIFILCTFIYFFLCQVVSRLLLTLNHSAYQTLLSILYAAVVFTGVTLLLNSFDALILIFNVLYLSLISLLRFSRALRAFGYLTYLYLFVSAVISAGLGAYSIYSYDEKMDMVTKKKFAEQLLVENDKLGEFLLNDISNKIQEDQMIKTRLLASFSKDLIIQKIKRFYLGSYFDKYDVNVLIFSGNGEPYNYDITYDSMRNRYSLEQFRTEHKNLFFITDLPTNTKRYLNFIDIYRKGLVIGKIIIDLKLKKVIPNSVYPNLFLDKRFANYYEDDDVSYAIYRNRELLYSFGNYDYNKDFLGNFKKKNAGVESEVVVDDHRHLLIRGQNGRNIVITSLLYPIKSILSNFSFLFLALVLVKLMFVSAYNFYFKQVHINLNFTTRIQLYLNLAFFLPLIIISVLIISILNSANRNETKEAYIKKAENVSLNLGTELENMKKGMVSREKMLDLLVEISRLTQMDINVFDETGRLVVSSQPFIYENGLLSELINPLALADLIEQKQSKVMLSESVGTLEYSSVYVGIKSYETGEVLGILGIPFFESQRKSEQQIIDVLCTIMNVFTFIFIMLLVLSYFASRILTAPLEMLTQKIKRTTLSNHNEPLDYHSEDEIGLLVGAYNKMLVKLEQSKEALSRSEKESAWREMAKQVAHEIKNPLTPMKLTLQHLQRVFSNEKPNVNRSIETLLTQIDTLSDIATSFAAFANMPIPKNERFEIGHVLKQTVVLYNNDENALLSTEVEEGEFYVMGDQKLMGRIFTNLILNGIQAVPRERAPEIHICLKKFGMEKVLIEIRDNGTGIAEHIQHKVFLPNFSTKFTGSGIGLALAKRGIEHAGGRIWFETEEDEGTAFFIEMPLMQFVEKAAEVKVS